MNQEKIGKFIAECRKNKKLTQQELAEKLNVSDKSISRWENGKTMMDISLFEPLCNELDITINELLEENPSGFEMTSTELYNQILFHTKNKPNVGSAGALTKAINKLQFDMWHYDSIYYESPNANGGSKGRKLYFCRRKDKKE